MAARATRPESATRLADQPRVPISDCAELWEGLLERRQLQPPKRVGNLAQIGRYQILRQLGAGGMGIVLLARDSLDSAATDPHSSSGLVAIKIPRPELCADHRTQERFLAEARHLQQFDHPHILRLLEIHTASSQPFLVMPHFRRGNLAQHLRQHGALVATETLTLALQIASALLHAHTHGIIHRDLKPANVLLTDQGQAVLTDFGLARTVFNDCVPDIACEHREGTAPYMSPAVARGEAEDTRCDIYGFGALLYEMLTGRPPYDGHTTRQIRHQVLTAPPPPIDQLHPEASPHLTAVANWAMARELHQRYAHMVDVLSDLQRIEANLPPLGPHPCLPTNDRKPPRKPKCYRLSLQLALALLASVAGMVWYHQQSEALTPRPRNGTAFTNPTLPAPPPPNPGFLIADGELLMLQKGTPPLLTIQQRFRLPALPPPPNRVSIDLLSDVDHDGRKELILRLGPAPDGPLTTLACFDVANGELRWTMQEPDGFLLPTLVDREPGTARRILVSSPSLEPYPKRTHLVSADGQTQPLAPLPSTP